MKDESYKATRGILKESYLRPNDDLSPREVRLRDGRKAWICAVMPDGKLCGYVATGGGVPYTVWGWYCNGNFLTDGGRCGYDITAPGPRFVEEWRIVNKNNGEVLAEIRNTQDSAETFFRVHGFKYPWVIHLIRRNLDTGAIETITPTEGK